MYTIKFFVLFVIVMAVIIYIYIFIYLFIYLFVILPIKEIFFLSWLVYLTFCCFVRAGVRLCVCVCVYVFICVCMYIACCRYILAIIISVSIFMYIVDVYYKVFIDSVAIFSAYHWLFVRVCCSLVYARLCSSFSTTIYISYRIPYA
jgi:hypothetical protein